MPLIVITGVPCSGKTTRANELKKYFEEQEKDVVIVSEEDEFKKAKLNRNSFFKDGHKEKQIRGSLKSAVMKLIGPKNVVILDASNYIKGFRYELFCASKNNKCNQCTIHCLINIDEAFKINETRPEEDRYTKEIYDALCMRYEYPEGKNRWDSPLFTVQMSDELDYDEIFKCLFGKNVPKPNKSTQNAPLSDTNFLYELDKITNEISQELIIAKKNQGTGKFCMSNYQDFEFQLDNVNISQINMLRRQYITYSKMHTPDVKNIATLYLQYLKTNINK